MMATLDTLIKLSQKKLEDHQKKLVTLESELGVLTVLEEALKRQIKAGYKTAENTGILAGYQDAASYLLRAELEQDQIDERRALLNTQKEEMLTQMRQLFAEKKRYEVLHDTQQAAAQKKRAKKEQNNLEDLVNR